MPRGLVKAVATTLRGIATAIRARPNVLVAVILGVFVLNLFLPVLVLSLARKPVDALTFNPWLSKLPEWLASGKEPVSRKVEFLSQLALAWFSAESDNPLVGREWGFVVDVLSFVRFIFTSFLFGAYFALWVHRRDQAKHCGWAPRAGRHGGVAGVLTSVLGFSTGPCSVVGCGVPVLPVVGLAFTGLPTETLKVFATLSGVAVAVVLFAVTLGVAYLGWQVGANPMASRPLRS
ncbi:MAG: hypothetical protein HYV62_03435 [Candidatus Rokubacteria bacterium]|nr:hypothetical protein [Candidatus Rokubacteria bacterium]